MGPGGMEVSHAQISPFSSHVTLVTLTSSFSQVCCECGCDEAVFPLSVSLMDRFLSASLSRPVSPYCLMAGCILIASKLTECENVTADTLCASAEYSFQPSNLRVSRSCSILRHIEEE